MKRNDRGLIEAICSIQKRYSFSQISRLKFARTAEASVTTQCPEFWQENNFDSSNKYDARKGTVFSYVRITPCMGFYNQGNETYTSVPEENLLTGE
jgi:hypothetical protein